MSGNTLGLIRNSFVGSNLRLDRVSPYRNGTVHCGSWYYPEFLNPKSEIETGNLPQSHGHKRIEKISTDHFGYASIFSICFCSKILRHLAGLNFGIRAKGTVLCVPAIRGVGRGCW